MRFVLLCVVCDCWFIAFYLIFAVCRAVIACLYLVRLVVPTVLCLGITHSECKTLLFVNNDKCTDEFR